MTHTLFIKNMVCNRCKMTVLNLMNDQGLEVESIELGKIVFKDHHNNDYKKLEKSLNEKGFELIKEVSEIVIEKIKTILIQLLERRETENILQELSHKIGKNYASLSKTFSKSEGMTLEKYLINLKIEKVKEDIQLNQLNFSEIAYNLNYKSSSHLAKQFKAVTGMSMSVYKKSQDWDRKALDKIV